jgi:hypothetical protein
MNYNSIKGYEDYTLKIEVEDTGVINLNIDNTAKNLLYISGYDCAVNYINNLY